VAQSGRGDDDDDVEIELLSPASPQQRLRAWHQLNVVVQGEELAGLDPPSWAETLSELQTTVAERRWALLARDGDEAVGGYAGEESLLEDLDVGWGWLLVAPAHRRTGVGTRIAQAARERHLAAGRQRVESSVRVDSPAAAFAKRLGARVTQIEQCNVLRLADIGVDLDDVVARPAAGYELRTWLGSCPAELVEAYAAAHAAMNDVPRGDDERDDWSWTPDRVRAAEARHKAAGVSALTSVAVHIASGEIAGYTDLQLSGRPTTAIQEDTGVVRDHRGHGLGLLVKAANLLALRRVAPQIDTVMTWNAETNTHMLAVNHRIGFRLHSRWEQVMLEL
jgi:GNAT superfamily N-acetyltransferase